MSHNISLSRGQKDGDPVRHATPSHLAPSPQKRPKRLSCLFTGLLAAGLIGLMLFFLWLAGSALGLFSPAQPDAAASQPSPAASQLEEEALIQAYARAQAEAATQDYLQEIPTVLEDVEGIQVDLLPLNEYSRPGVPLEAVNAIVIHYVGNPETTAQQNRDYFASLAETGEDSVSSHFVIGTDGTIIQCIPLDEKSYCTNHRNRDTISIECCHPDSDGQFTPQTEEALISLVRYLAQGYGLGYDDVIRHYDVTGKECPKYYVEHEDAWIALKDAFFSDS